MLPVLLVVEVALVVLMVGLIGAGGGGGGGETPPVTEMPTALPEELLTTITPLFVIPPEYEDWLTWMPNALGPLVLTWMVPVLLLMIPPPTTEPPVTRIPPGVPPLALIWPLFERDPPMVELLMTREPGAGELGGPIVPVEVLLTLPVTVALLKLKQSTDPVLLKKAKAPDIGLHAQALPPSPTMIASAEVAERMARL